MADHLSGRDDARGLLAVATFAMFSTMVARLAISPVVPDIIAAFDASSSTVGLALTGMWAAYSLTQFPSGIVADRVGERRVILSALGLTSLATLLLALAPSYPLFLVFIVLLGAVAGLYFSPATSLLTSAYEETGQPLGVHSAGAPIAGLVAPVVAAELALAYSWRAGLLWTAGVSGVATLLVWRYVPATPPRAPDSTVRERVELRTLFELLKRPPVVYTSVLGTVGYFAWQAFASFFPAFLITYGEVQPDTASVLFGTVFAVSIVGMPLCGRFSDRFSRQGVLAVALLACAAGWTLLLVTTALWALVVGAVGLSFGISWTGVLNARYMDIFDRGEQGTGFGLVRTVVGVVSSVGSVVTGFLVDTAGWTSAYGLVIVLLLGAVCLVAVNEAFGFGW